MTTARYYTPSGKSIQVSGITPDIEIDFVPIEEKESGEVTQFWREVDLEGHMENEIQKIPIDINDVRPKEMNRHLEQEKEGQEDQNQDSKGQESEDMRQKKNEEPKDSDTMFRERLERDNQILLAIQILNSWNAITQINAVQPKN